MLFSIMIFKENSKVSIKVKSIQLAIRALVPKKESFKMASEFKLKVKMKWIYFAPAIISILNLMQDKSMLFRHKIVQAKVQCLQCIFIKCEDCFKASIKCSTTMPVIIPSLTMLLGSKLRLLAKLNEINFVKKSKVNLSESVKDEHGKAREIRFKSISAKHHEISKHKKELDKISILLLIRSIFLKNHTIFSYSKLFI